MILQASCGPWAKLSPHLPRLPDLTVQFPGLHPCLSPLLLPSCPWPCSPTPQSRDGASALEQSLWTGDMLVTAGHRGLISAGEPQLPHQQERETSSCLSGSGQQSYALCQESGPSCCSHDPYCPQREKGKQVVLNQAELAHILNSGSTNNHQ